MSTNKSTRRHDCPCDIFQNVSVKEHVKLHDALRMFIQSTLKKTNSKWRHRLYLRLLHRCCTHCCRCSSFGSEKATSKSLIHITVLHLMHLMHPKSELRTRKMLLPFEKSSVPKQCLCKTPTGVLGASGAAPASRDEKSHVESRRWRCFCCCTIAEMNPALGAAVGAAASGPVINDQQDVDKE